MLLKWNMVFLRPSLDFKCAPFEENSWLVKKGPPNIHPFSEQKIPYFGQNKRPLVGDPPITVGSTPLSIECKELQCNALGSTLLTTGTLYGQDTHMSSTTTIPSGAPGDPRSYPDYNGTQSWCYSMLAPHCCSGFAPRGCWVQLVPFILGPTLVTSLKHPSVYFLPASEFRNSGGSVL